jgi:hypothetical protein
MEMTTTGMAGVSMPTARPLMMLVAGPVSEDSAMSLTGTVTALSVVLGDPDEEEGRGKADDAAGEEPAGFDAGAVEHLPDDDAEARERDGGSDVEAAVERVHRVFGLFGADDGDADGGGDEVDRVDDQRKEDALDSEDRKEGSSEDHGADGLGGGGLEDVGTAAGAVANVVTDEVGDDGRVAGVVFGDAGFDFADEVRAYVSGLGVDAAAKLGEERDQRGSEAEADELVNHGCGVARSAIDEEEDADAEQRQRHDDEAGDGASAKRGLQGFVQRAACSGSGANVRADGHVHAGEAGDA